MWTIRNRITYNQGVHDIYHKAPVSNFEIHRALFSEATQPMLFSYYRDVKRRLIQNNDAGSGYHFCTNDFYIYMIAHEFKHYAGGGTGLRSLLDLYIFLREFEAAMNWGYISGELTKLGILDFEERNRSLAVHLFSGNALFESEQELLDDLIISGTYGTEERMLRKKIEK